MAECPARGWRLQRPHWSTECLDILAPDGVHTHVHGTWVGWHEGDLKIALSAPYNAIPVGGTLLVQPIVQLWRPLEKRYVYRPREHVASLPVETRDWLRENPAWDSDCVAVNGPWRHQ